MPHLLRRVHHRRTATAAAAASNVNDAGWSGTARLLSTVRQCSPSTVYC